MKDKSKEIADLLVRANCYCNYEKQENKKIQTTNGDWVPAYLSCRLLISQVKYREKVEKYLTELVKDNFKENVFIVGMATAGIPWAHSIANNLKLPLTYMRSSKKQYGLGGYIEGRLEDVKNKKAIIVDDVVYSGESFYKAKSILEENSVEIDGVVCIASLKERIVEKIKSEGINVFQLTDDKNLLESAYENKILNDKELAAMQLIYERSFI